MAMSLHSEETMIVTAYLKEFILSEELTATNESGDESIYGSKLFHTKDGIANGERPRGEGMGGHKDVIGYEVCHGLLLFL
jgi:hypothetical protein